MTIINGIEIDYIHVPIDQTREALLNNEPIDTTLHVIAVLSNPCQFARRYILAREFIKRMERENGITLYVVELAYGDHDFHVTEKKNKRHLQLRGSIPLWHKENMINIGIKKLLPSSWKAVAWIDADIDFESVTWAKDTLKILNGYKDVVQLFSHCIDMDKRQNAMSIFPSFCFQYSKGRPYGGTGVNMWHPGYAWACTRKAYEKMGGLYDKSILGAGDHNMSLAYLGKGIDSVNSDATDGYKESIISFEEGAKTLRLGYVPGVIRHHYHGLKKDRKYMERWHILVDNKFSPDEHLTYNKDGLLIPTAGCPQKILDDIVKYFKERNEDEGYEHG
jgi:hypothetical protein